LNSPQTNPAKSCASPQQVETLLSECRQYFETPNFEECRLILEAFGFAREGFFIEVGANHPQRNSLTYLLERLGWSGILVDPLTACYEKLVKARPRSRSFRCACVGPDKVGTLTLHAPYPMSEAATVEKNVDDFDMQYAFTETCDAVTLDSLVEQVKPARIDFLSLDTEGTEMDVLLGFDLARHRPRLILIEDKLYHLTKHRYLVARGYRLLKRTMLNNWYVRADEQDLGIRSSLGERLSLWKKMLAVSAYFRRRRRDKRMRQAGGGPP
jgi:FkbM family methyltransferase